MKKTVFAIFTVAAILSGCGSSTSETAVQSTDTVIVAVDTAATDSVVVADSTAVVVDTTKAKK